MKKNTSYYYSKKSVLEFKELANQYWENHQYEKAKEYYLRAQRIIVQLSLDEGTIETYLNDHHLEEILIQENNTQQLKEYYEWIIDCFKNSEEYRGKKNALQLLLKIIQQPICEMDEKKEYLHRYELISRLLLKQDKPLKVFYHGEERLFETPVNEVLNYILELRKKENGVDSEEYYTILFQKGDWFFSCGKIECITYYDEVIEWLKRNKDINELEKVLIDIVSKEIDESYYTFEVSDYYDYMNHYFPQLIEIQKSLTGRQDYDLLLARTYSVYGRNMMYLTRDVEKGKEYIDLSLSIYNRLYEVGSEELNRCYAQLLFFYVVNRMSELAVELDDSYKSRIKEKYGEDSELVKTWVNVLFGD